MKPEVARFIKRGRGGERHVKPTWETSQIHTKFLT